ncbi:protein transport protein SEC13 [Nematocida major]|uniref:protein transport protein SEC13 n=1 Tax=Nematocida major TaxID=1912982 RepID=UPI002008CEA9|nr:protein transport protein SEC13 [Nematocida major]KAH9386513.1 protein transport protein SEC13 [Nematocida major]
MSVETQNAETLVQNLQSNASGDMVAAGAEDGSVTIFKIQEQAHVPVQKLSYSASAIFSTLFLGERVVAATHDGHLLVWKMGPTEYAFESAINVFEGSINVIAECKGDILCGCSDGKIRRVMLSGETSAAWTAHKRGVTGVSVHKNYIISVGMDGLVKIWSEADLSLALEVREHAKPVRDCKVCINEFGAFVFATCADDGKLLIFVEDKDSPLKFSIDAHELGSPCTKLSWTQLGYALAVGYGKGEAKIFMPAGPGKWKEASIVLP